ncbi:hypothetical protein KCU94_g10992, partial [Aureobasidium melanogenum]
MPLNPLIGRTSALDISLLGFSDFGSRHETNTGFGKIRRVADSDFFSMHTDAAFSTYEDELQTLVAVEQTVAPYGPSLIDLYFRNVHPSFPILQKHTFMDRHRCGDRQFHSGLLAGMYLLALRWWHRDPVLSQHPKPSVYRLEELAARSLSMAMQHPKLSALQAGLLLLQRRQSTDWGLTVQLVALAQDLGLHIDCTNWDIPIWERRLRKRLAWALYMQDKWTALVHGRPSHIQAADWAVSTLTLDDFNEEFENADQQVVADEESEEEEKSRVIFIQMIELTSIMAEVIDVFYTQRANAEFEKGGRNATRLILERAKPVQLKLKEWFSKLPAVARMDAYTPGKLSSNGYLHLAYFATEISIHRRIVQSLQPSSTDPYVLYICRSAAKTRLISAMDFVNRLKPEHLDSFWYFASATNFALINTFGNLLRATAPGEEEAGFYSCRLKEYRWALGASCRRAEWLEGAVRMLDATDNLVDGLGHRQQNVQHTINEEMEGDGEGDLRKVPVSDDLDGLARNGTEWLGVPQRVMSRYTEKLRRSAIVVGQRCARWRIMVGLNKNAPPLLRTVGGKPHATAEDHEQKDEQRAPDSSDDDNDSDNDTSGLGKLPSRKPTRLRVPGTNRNTNKPVIPAKREAESGDELDNLIFSQPSSSQSKRPLKTFGKKSFTARNKVARQQEKTASSFQPSTVQPQPEPPKKKAGFRTLPAPEPSSSQAEAPSVASAPTFRHHANAAADSTDISGQSQPIALESSQLSPPPSSPISSICDFDLEQTDKSPRCPICGEKIEQEFWDKFQDEICHRRMNLRLQERFCQAHKARTADDVWQDRGYPSINWSALQSRLRAHHAHIHAILDGNYESPYYKQHAKLVSQSKGRSAGSAAASGRFTGLRAGYYGTKGEKIMAENIVQTFSDELRALSKTEPLMASSGASGGVSGYVHAILVPEMALGLIMEDMNCDREKARVVLADSADIGEMFNAEEDEKVQHVEIDLLDTSGTNDDDEVATTQKPRKGFRLV